jgi:HEAT repeat protein
MPSIDELRRLARASMRRGAADRAAVLEELGSPSDREVVDAALGGLDSDDRNVRVAMLRVLAWYPNDEAAEGIARGLRDPVRRVREVAAKSSRAFTRYPVVAEALRAIVETDPDRRVRDPAFGALAGGADIGLPYGPSETWGVPDVSLIAVDTLRDLVQLDRYRTLVLGAVARAVDLTDDVRTLLEEIVRVGTKAEAVSATRALCGYRVARIDEFDPAEQRRVKETCARARGEHFYWVPRNPVP